MTEISGGQKKISDSTLTPIKYMLNQYKSQKFKNMNPYAGVPADNAVYSANVLIHVSNGMGYLFDNKINYDTL